MCLLSLVRTHSLTLGLTQLLVGRARMLRAAEERSPRGRWITSFSRPRASSPTWQSACSTRPIPGSSPLASLPTSSSQVCCGGGGCSRVALEGWPAAVHDLSNLLFDGQEHEWRHSCHLVVVWQLCCVVLCCLVLLSIFLVGSPQFRIHHLANLAGLEASDSSCVIR